MASELQVNTITEATSGSGITFAKDVIPATPLSHRNMIDNGAMAIAQRWTTNADRHDNGYIIDRWKIEFSNEDQLRVTIGQSGTAPADQGFVNSLYVDVDSGDAETAIAADEYVKIVTRLEGFDCQRLRYGTSNAQTTTLSFWVRAKLTGTYAVSIYQGDGNQIIGGTYTINTADTWEKKSVTFAGNTVNTIADDNTNGIQVQFYLMAGSNYTGTSNTSWGANNSYVAGKEAHGHTAAWGTSDTHDFYLTGVQWELGSVATPFEHRSYAEDLAKCQRYCEILAEGSDQGLGLVLEFNPNQPTTSLYFQTHFTTSKRTDLYSITGIGTGNYLRIRRNNNIGATITGNFQNRGHHRCLAYVTAASDPGIDGGAAWLETNSSDAKVFIDDDF